MGLLQRAGWPLYIPVQTRTLLERRRSIGASADVRIRRRADVRIRRCADVQKCEHADVQTCRSAEVQKDDESPRKKRVSLH
jgi:hypothetical protein